MAAREVPEAEIDELSPRVADRPVGKERRNEKDPQRSAPTARKTSAAAIRSMQVGRTSHAVR